MIEDFAFIPTANDPLMVHAFSSISANCNDNLTKKVQDLARKKRNTGNKR